MALNIAYKSDTLLLRRKHADEISISCYHLVPPTLLSSCRPPNPPVPPHLVAELLALRPYIEHILCDGSRDPHVCKGIRRPPWGREGMGGGGRCEGTHVRVWVWGQDTRDVEALQGRSVEMVASASFWDGVSMRHCSLAPMRLFCLLLNLTRECRGLRRKLPIHVGSVPCCRYKTKGGPSCVDVSITLSLSSARCGLAC